VTEVEVLPGVPLAAAPFWTLSRSISTSTVRTLRAK